MCVCVSVCVCECVCVCVCVCVWAGGEKTIMDQGLHISLYFHCLVLCSSSVIFGPLCNKQGES